MSRLPTSPLGSGTYLKLVEEMIARAPIVDASLNLKMNQNSLDWVYADHQTDTFKVDNEMVYQIFSKMFTDMDALVYVKERSGMKDGQAVFLYIHKCFFSHDHIFSALKRWSSQQ